MGNPFIIHKDDDPKSLPSDYCRYNQQHFAPEHVISRLQRNPFRRVGDVARERYAMDPWLPGSQLQRVVEREREREREAPAGTVDPDRTDVDSMPDLVTVGDWDQFTEGDTDDDGGHIVDDYGVEEMPALLTDAQLVSDSYADWLTDARPSREAFMPHLVAPELVESNVLAEWASHRRPRTRPERAERPQNLSAERARSGVPDISQRTAHAETLSLMRREWALAREQQEARSSNPDNLANVRRVAREVLAQMDVRIAEMRARNRRLAQPGDDAHTSADDMQATRDLLPFGPAEVNMTMQSVRARVEARREATARAAARRAEAAERAVRAANDTDRLVAAPVRALQSGAAQLRM
ncbi:hypothetical protein COCOBI_05-2760 [Coccomyxa sp. Obi]|nr:hypothetical protein COCOBI_05-2760 [Coccomyxa sp. Obi]